MAEDGGTKDSDESNVINLRSGGKNEPRIYERTMVDNSRRYRVDGCKHRGPYTFDRALATVECGDCGALLNPIFVIEQLAYREAYWNKRQEDLSKYLAKITKEIEDRSRTKCLHCGNMTPIRFKGEMPRTWVPEPY